MQNGREQFCNINLFQFFENEKNDNFKNLYITVNYFINNLHRGW